ncbi:MAG: hypothetical protein HQK83_00685 [Fibrobacteria bacterium]|nr:hypothetical protein [Fibrobacteria bacterium]
MTFPVYKSGKWITIKFSLRAWFFSQINVLFIGENYPLDEKSNRQSPSDSRLYLDPKAGIYFLPENIERRELLAIIKVWDKKRRNLTRPSQSNIYDFLIKWFYQNRVKVNPRKYLYMNFITDLKNITEFLWERELDNMANKMSASISKELSAHLHAKKILMNSEKPQLQIQK